MMAQSKKRKRAGKLHQVKGKVKQKLASATDDRKREAEGRREISEGS
jgi:uncharacterized protein YjbJ (UPF0337 family)